ncbi:hypothetical protein ACIPX0_45465 [Streptomyces sp. NPDC090075]|uniref:hypothetical protein n=1 Tax=Streptomyces sp. NPDC090075 TaxID=3365937 RepID=UPI0038232998
MTEPASVVAALGTVHDRFGPIDVLAAAIPVMAATCGPSSPSKVSANHPPRTYDTWASTSPPSNQPPAVRSSGQATDKPPLRLPLGHGLFLPRRRLTARQREYDHRKRPTDTTL